MTNPSNTVFVSILDKDYQVACPPQERDALLLSAHELDRRMRTIRESGSVIGLERIAVMAGLNLCHELLQTDLQTEDKELNEHRLKSLSEKLDSAIEGLS